jgi:hypothetical protein
VNIVDLIILAQQIGKTNANNTYVDVNMDGQVDILDLQIIFMHLGEAY